MVTETEEKDLETQVDNNENDMFVLTDEDLDEQEEVDKDFVESLDKIGDDKEASEQQQQAAEEEEQEEEEQEEEDDGIDFDSKNPNSEYDLEAFNKKFNTTFKSDEELRTFLDNKETQVENDQDDQALEQATTQIDALIPFLEKQNGVYVVDSETLMLKQFQTVAMQENKNLNDPDVQLEITEKLEDLKDKGVLDIYADNLRNKLEKIVDQHTTTKNQIEQKREDKRLAEEKASQKSLQDELIGFYNVDNFYGVKLEKDLVKEVYQDINSGNFIESLQNDHKLVAELALMAKVKEKIFKKSSGLTYNDGLGAVLGEFKTKQKANPVVKAQSRGTAAADGSKGLIDAILYEAPQEDDKKQ